MMKTNLAPALLGFLSGGLASLFLSALFLAWPVRTLILALVLILAFGLIMRQRTQALSSASLAAAWFVLGYALAAALLVALDFIFPPLT
jgi:uncharacterized membrane protein YjfL (UPF0719 family)